MLCDSTLTGIVSSEGQNGVFVEFLQQPIQVGHATADILPWITTVANAKSLCSCWDKLHQTFCAGMADRIYSPGTFDRNNRQYQSWRYICAYGCGKDIYAMALCNSS